MHGFEHYAIIAAGDIIEIDFNEIGESSQDTLRYSIDESKFVIKYNETPSFIADGSVTPLQTLTQQQAVELMKTSDWHEQPE